MGLVIEIEYCYDWKRVYFVQDLNEKQAKQKAFTMFKNTMSCWLPDTLEEAENDDQFIIDILTEVEQIIL